MTHLRLLFFRDLVQYFHFCFICSATHFIVLFTLEGRVKRVHQNIKSNHVWMRLSVSYDLLSSLSSSSLSLSLCLSLFLCASLCLSLSFVSPDCSVTVWALNIADWSGPGGPGSQLPYVCFHLSLNLSLLVTQRWVSLLMNVQLCSRSALVLHIYLSGHRGRQNKSKPPKSVAHTIPATILNLYDFINSLCEHWYCMVKLAEASKWLWR